MQSKVRDNQPKASLSKSIAYNHLAELPHGDASLHRAPVIKISNDIEKRLLNSGPSTYLEWISKISAQE